jgi:translation initiation factor 2 beta subunit (eIF-2beta)/eIF-5
LRRKLELTTNFTERQIQQKLQRSIYKHVMCKATSPF